MKFSRVSPVRGALPFAPALPHMVVGHGRRASARVALHLQPFAYELAKRTLDVLVSGSLLIALSPLFVLIAVLIRLTDSGSAVYLQDRVGESGKLFHCPKFRSMVPNAHLIRPRLAGRNHHGESITFKMKDDPRVTWIGRILRRYSLDELPQLWCVLKGDMSIVGPRPALPNEVALYNQRARKRLAVKPGLTCIWQVSGRADIPFPQQLKLDVDYIERRNLVFDLKLVAVTIPAVLFGRGAY